jgi:EpsI family protein
VATCRKACRGRGVVEPLFGSRPVDAARTVDLPAVRPPWVPVAAEGGLQPVFQGADVTVTRTYAAGDRRAELAIVYYTRQVQGAEVVNSQNSLAGGDGWMEMGWGRDEVIVDGRRLDVPYRRYRTPDGFRVVWSWYWVDGRYTGTPLVAKMLEVRAKLSGSHPGAAVVAVVAPYDERLVEAKAVRESFLASLAPLGPVLEQMSGR